jgi:hypothetical protein
MCDSCLHKVVCSIYRATGGVKKCEHHKEERKGKWLNRHGEPVTRSDYFFEFMCSECENWYFNDEQVCLDDFYSSFCPNCGADMRGEEDGN